MKPRLTALVFLLLPGLLAAQEPFIHTGAATGGSFFAALVGGVILAVGFQVVLTLLSLSTGLSAISLEGGDSDDDSGTSKGWGHTARVITSGMGVWTLVSASVALFFASWLALVLLPGIQLLEAAVLGLTIWGLFYLLVVGLEAVAVTSLVGTLARTAMGGLRRTMQMAGSLFTKSPDKRFADLAGRVTREVKDELMSGVDLDRVEDRFFDAVHELADSGLDAERLVAELRGLFDQTEIHALRLTPFDEEAFVASLRSEHGMEESRARPIARRARGAVELLRREMGEKDRVSGAADAGMQLAGMDRQQAEERRQQIEAVLRESGHEELDPDELKRRIEEMIDHPRSAPGQVRELLAAFDRDTIVDLIAAGTDRDRSEVDHVAQRIESVIERVRSEVRKHTASESLDEDEMSEPQQAAVAARATSRLARICNAAGDPELRYEAVRRDLRRVVSEPGPALQSLRERLQHIDRERLARMIAATRTDLTSEQVDAQIERALALRDDLVHRAQDLQHRTEDRLHRLQDEARHQAEEARKTTALAAWWTFGAATCSGAAAALGAMLGAWM